jgi:hypothetical protein
VSSLEAPVAAALTGRPGLGRTRLLYLPDEEHEGDQVGPRYAYARLAAEGRLTGYEAFSFLVEANRTGADDAARRLVERAQRFEPTIILWCHPVGFPITGALVDALRRVPSQPTIVLQEMDPFGFVRCRPRRGLRVLARRADVVYLSGTGPLTRVFQLAGARRIRYALDGADHVRFGTPWSPPAEREFDVVMIANRNRGRYPGTALPGARRRARLAAALQRRHGRRFGLFGDGWSGFTSWRGPVAFDQQGETNRRAWVSASWDHLPSIQRYCSNRVPISLLSGIPHVTNHNEGIDQLYPPGSGVFWGRSVSEVADAVGVVLASPVPDLLALGEQASAFARTHRCQESLAERLLEDVVTLRASDQSSAR